LKKELVRRRSWPTKRELQCAVYDYIETFYNRERRHSTLGYLSPREFEMVSIDKKKIRIQSPDVSPETGAKVRPSGWESRASNDANNLVAWHPTS
jgi:hypothetical protein